jgi:uncharacterized protein
MRIGVISDTHVRYPGQLHRGVWRALEGVELVLHAGDHVGPAAVEELELIAPVLNVRGNCDLFELDAVPRWRIEIVADHCVGLVHGDEFINRTIMLREMNRRVGPLDVLVYGHTHVAHVEMVGGVLLLNPGSPTRPRGGTKPSVAILDLGGLEPRAVVVPL